MSKVVGFVYQIKLKSLSTGVGSDLTAKLTAIGSGSQLDPRLLGPTFS